LLRLTVFSRVLRASHLCQSRVSPSEIGEHAYGNAVGNFILGINVSRPAEITHGVVGPACVQGISPCLNVPADLDAGASGKIDQYRQTRWHQELLSRHKNFFLISNGVQPRAHA
jgi:hypothetical protein